jgi:hypothetical protein
VREDEGWEEERTLPAPAGPMTSTPNLLMVRMFVRELTAWKGFGDRR